MPQRPRGRERDGVGIANDGGIGGRCERGDGEGQHRDGHKGRSGHGQRHQEKETTADGGGPDGVRQLDAIPDVVGHKRAEEVSQGPSSAERGDGEGRAMEIPSQDDTHEGKDRAGADPTDGGSNGVPLQGATDGFG